MVVRRVRWGVDAQQLGIALGYVFEDTLVVMWCIDQHKVRFDHHLSDALLTVDEGNLSNVKGRLCTFA